MNLIDYLTDDSISAICFQSTGNYTLSGKAVLDDTHAHALVRKYPEISKNLAFKLKEKHVNIPYIVGAIDTNLSLINNLNIEQIKSKQYNKLFISCPVKFKVNDEINFQLLKQSVAVIEDYINSYHIDGIVLAAPKVATTKNIIFI